MNDLERWIHCEGPEPPRIRDLLDAMCAVPELSPEEDARMKRAIHLALDEDDRRYERRRRWSRALGGSAVLGGLAAAAGLALWLKGPSHASFDVAALAPNAIVAPLATPPSATAPTPSATPPRRAPPKVPAGGRARLR